MHKRYGFLVYNVLFPVWLLVWVPSVLWLALVPANYLIDRIVLRWGLGRREDRDAFCRKHTWKVCLVGFASDFLASALLLGMCLLLDSSASDLVYQVSWDVMFNPFGHVGAFACTVACIAVAGVLIFVLDRWILRRAGLDAGEARAAALRLALCTAPYLFLFPSELLYR